jgi:hypothetical protein
MPIDNISQVAVMEELRQENLILHANVERLESELQAAQALIKTLMSPAAEMRRIMKESLLACEEPSTTDICEQKTSTITGFNKKDKKDKKENAVITLNQHEDAALILLQQRGLIQWELSMERAVLLHLASGDREVRLAIRVHIAKLMLPRLDWKEDFTHFCAALGCVIIQAESKKDVKDTRSAFMKAAADRIDGMQKEYGATATK